MPAVRGPRDLRGGPLLLRSLVRGLILQSISFENRPTSPLSFDRVDSSDDGPTPVERNPPHEETEPPPDVRPEDVLSRPLVDVPDAVRGDFREPSRRGGRGEGAQRPHGHDVGPRRQGGPGPRLVPPRRIRRADARGMAGPRRADPRPLAREAGTVPLTPDRSGPHRPPSRPPSEFGSASINSGRRAETTIGSEHRNRPPYWVFPR